jgi:hypothetical protein
MYITPYTFKQTLYRHRNKQGLEEDRNLSIVFILYNKP